MAIDNQDHIFYTYKEKIESEEQFKDFFWGGDSGVTEQLQGDICDVL